MSSEIKILGSLDPLFSGEGIAQAILVTDDKTPLKICVQIDEKNRIWDWESDKGKEHEENYKD